jgi:hypothetical protein
MERVKSVPARPRWRWRERAHAAMRSTIGGGAALSLRYFWCFCYFAAPGLYAYTSQGPGLQGFRMRTERCGRCVGCGIRRSCRRPISRPITFYNIIPNSLSYSKFPHQQINILFYCGGGSGYRQPCRTPCARARCTVTVLAQLISDTWVPSWAPLLWPRARRHRSPHNRMPRVPNVRHLHFPLPPTSRPPIVSNGSARLLARQHRVVARPQPHACGRLVAQMARPLGAMHSPTVKDLRVTTCSPLLRPWNLLPCRSPP